MKKSCVIVIALIIVFGLTGCAIPQIPGMEAVEETKETQESPDVGKEIEQFGFVFKVPPGITKNTIDRMFYDMDFGDVGKREAFISLVEPEDVGSKTASEMSEQMYAMATEKFADLENVVRETRTFGGQQAEYIGLDCNLSGLATNWQMYMIVSNGKLYSVTIHIFKDSVTEDTLKAIDEFVNGIRFVG